MTGVSLYDTLWHYECTCVLIMYITSAQFTVQCIIQRLHEQLMATKVDIRTPDAMLYHVMLPFESFISK